jgi:hypothetical protein
MKSIFLVLVLCAVGTLLSVNVAVWAQGDAPCNDSFCKCLSDHSCSVPDCQTDCASTSFTVPCTGVYTFVAKVICTNTDDHCYDCYSCLKVTDGINDYQCHTNDCWNQRCEQKCSNAYTLYEGVQYTMTVCLGFCPNHSSCDACGQSCTAWGCVYRNVITECVPF